MIKLFTGTANPCLSEEVSKILKLPLSKTEVIRFGNSEVRVTIQEDVKLKTAIVIQPLANPTDTHLMELFFFCDALRRQEARRVIAYIPYFGYARQDIQHRPGECVSANVVIRFMESIGFAKIYTIDIHDEATEGVFSIPFKNLTALPLLAEKIKQYLKIKKPTDKEITVVSPDQGGVERARDFGTAFYGTGDFSMAVIEKRRDLQNIHKSKALDLYGDVSGKTVILVDDMVTSGGTLIHAAELCRSRGAKEVLAAIVHHDFTVDAPQKLAHDSIHKIFSTNTITLKPEQKFPKLEEISVAPLIAGELKNFI